MLRRHTAFPIIAVVFVLIAQAGAGAVDQTLIPAGALWKYNDSGANLGTTWRAAAFADSGWATGFAQLGYGDGDESTVLSYGSSTTNRRITYYFRHSFTVANPAAFAALTARFVRDDGVVVYLNGVEIARSNMPAGTVSYTTLASSAVADAAESQWFDVPVDPSRLVTGTNVVAVELHQSSASSSDISFDFELRGTEVQVPPPVVTLTAPLNHALSNQGAITFTADAAAGAGLASASLFVSGPPQTVAFSGAAQIEDAQITADTPTVTNGSGLEVNVDGQGPHAHGLMRFPTLVGAGAGQVPPGAVINSATLQITCTNPGNTMALYRLTQAWVEDQATWNQRQAGVAWSAAGADGAASNAGVALGGSCSAAGLRSIDITRFVQEWSNGAPNFGVVLTDTGTDGIDFSSSESASSPVLTVEYKDSLVPLATQALSGTSATASFDATVSQPGTWFWNVRVTDVNGAQSWAGADFEFTMDPSLPNEPALISPADNAVDVSPTAPLEMMVSAPAGGLLNVTAEVRPVVQPEFTIVVLPDTQHYSESNPAIFTAQTQWIKDNTTARNIVFVTHEGDIVENAGNVSEWQAANASMSILDGVVPYGMAPGNHDQPSGNYNTYFPFTRYAGLPWYGGHYQSLNDNNFELFSGGGVDFVIVHLEFCPPAGAVAWASGVLNAYPNRIGMMTTHGYLNESAQRTVHGCSNTQYLWDGLALTSPNLHFMLSGHVHDESRRTDTANGHPVYQLLADYQDRSPSGGEGWLRTMRFVPSEDRVYVQTYSPWLNQYETDANSEFTLDFPMGGAFTSVGSASVLSGATASITPTGLQPNTQYEWRATVTNASGKSRSGPVWRFTTGTGGPVNQPPVANDQSVSTPEDALASITLTGSDPEGESITYAIVAGPAHGSIVASLPGLFYQPAANFTGTDTITFRVNDGQDDSAVATLTITVLPVNDAPTASGEAYSVQAGSTLTINAPGVLGNDADIEATALAAELVTAPAHGALSLAANGSFVYTPAAGYSGTDSFSYRAGDGLAFSAPATVSLAVTAAPVVPILSANFNSSTQSFSYIDDAFRGTTKPAYATGTRVSTGGYTGGALRVYVGGVDSATITNMSGGWQRTFNLTAPTALTLSFRYNLNQGSDYETDELSQMLASIDGTLLNAGTGDWIAQVIGNGNGGAATTTGWRLVEINLGVLSAGTHTLRLGGFNNKKNNSSERTTILIDDVAVVVR